MNDKSNIDEADIKKANQAEEEAWQMAICLDTLESYRDYMDAYPQGMYVAVAHHRIDDMEYEQKERIIRELCEDRNAYSSSYIKACGISVDDLMGKIKSQGQVRDEVLRSWNKWPGNTFYGGYSTFIPKGNTEIYFWGTIGSGKSCVISSILHVARMTGLLCPLQGPGRPLLETRLNCFLEDPMAPAVCFPNADLVDSTQWLPLALSNKTGKSNNIAVIEVAGEILGGAITNILKGKPPRTPDHLQSLEHTMALLSSKENPKYHVFVLDIDSQSMGINREHELWNLVMFLREKGVFNRTTKGIDIIVSKCDLLSSDRNEWQRLAEETVNKYYGAFVNQLKRIVKEEGLTLTDGRIRVIPFSVGEQFLKNLCLYDPEPAVALLELLRGYEGK